MPTVEYQASKFGLHWGGSLSGSHSLSLSWNELVWAAMTVGKPEVAFLLAHGWHSVSDLIVRAHGVYANLRQVGGYVEKSSLYAALDPTEKSGVSYFMGMLATKVLAARLLNVPWLFHVSMIGALGGNVVLKGKSQPDLIGRRANGDWIVAEAKGRTLGYSSSAMDSAKLQTHQLRQVNGSYPALRVAVQAFFSPRLQWAVVDPEEVDEDAPDISFDLDSALEMYYSAALAATEQGAEKRVIANREFMTRNIEEIGVTIAIASDVRERVASRSLVQPAANLSSEMAADGDFVIFPDGLAISLDARWSEERMQIEPASRRGA